MADTVTHPIAAIRKNNAGEELRVTLSEFNGMRLVNLRVWFVADGGEMRPGKDGAALIIGRLPELADAMATAVDEARRIGWLPPAEATS